MDSEALPDQEENGHSTEGAHSPLSNTFFSGEKNCNDVSDLGIWIYLYL